MYMENNKNDDLQTDNNEKNLNDEFIEINENKTGLDRDISEAKFMGKQWLNTFKTQTIGCTIGVIIFLASLVLVPYFLSKIFEKYLQEGFIGIIVGFGGVILFTLIFMVLYRKIAMFLVKKDKNATETTGEVIASSMLSSRYVSSGSRSTYESRKVLGTVYKVKIQIGDKKTIGYSKNYYYKEGEQISIKWNPKKPHHCTILNNENE